MPMRLEELIKEAMEFKMNNSQYTQNNNKQNSGVNADNSNV